MIFQKGTALPASNPSGGKKDDPECGRQREEARKQPEQNANRGDWSRSLRLHCVKLVNPPRIEKGGKHFALGWAPTLLDDHPMASRKPLRSPSKKASDLTLLGSGPMRQLASPDEAVLETFPSPSPNPYEVTFSTREFTSLCPVTGQPDFAEITIRYIPDRLCIESKSLKQYLGSYRNQAVFAEGITNRILADVVRATSPRSAVVIGDFWPRGGIGIRVEARHEGSPRRKA